MDGLVAQIRQQSASSELLLKLLKKPDTTKLLKKSANEINKVLSEGALDPSTHSLGYLFLLHFKATNTEIKNHGEFVDQTTALFLRGDSLQLTMAPDKVCELGNHFSQSCLLVEKPIRAILPLKRAIEMLSQERPGQMFSLHSKFAQACLKAKFFTVAEPIISQDLVSVDRATGIVPLDYLQYNYYAGMLWVGLRRYDSALEHFQMTLTIQSETISAVQVEAFKKYVLCSLILHGDLASLPANATSTIVSKNVERLSDAYTDLAKAFKKGPAAVKKVLEEKADVYEKDKNHGLAMQAVKSMERRTIQRLTNTYVTLSLVDIAKEANLASQKEAEKYVLGMIADGQIHAQINQKDGMLSFLDGQEGYDTTLMAEKLDAKIRQVFSLTGRLDAVHKKIMLNPVYIHKTLPVKKGGEEGGALGLGGSAYSDAIGLGADDDDVEMRAAKEASLAHH